MPYIEPPPGPGPLSYSRDEVIQEITSFYTFLTTLHLPPSTLRLPPPTGWPAITPTTHSFLNKTPTVIDLMQHLPYLTRADASDAPEIYPLTAAVDYAGEQVARAIAFAEERGQEVDLFAIEPAPDEGYTAVPAHMLVLASETNGGDGSWFLLDTERGTVTLYDSCAGPKYNGTVENEPVEEGVNDREEWREYATWRVKEFFDMLKERYRKLELVPKNNNEVQHELGGDLGKAHLKIFEDCGWPDESRYRKDECMERIGKLWDGFMDTGEVVDV